MIEQPYDYRFIWLDDYNSHTLGPIQRDEALFLYGLCKMVRPKIVLEIGCLIGQSLRVWINADVPYIYAVDCIISDEVKRLQRGFNIDSRYTHDRMLCFEQDMKEPIDFVRGIPDLVFIDASHEVEDNIVVVKNLVNVLGSGALVIFHDTGHWKQSDIIPERQWFLDSYGGTWDEELQAWAHCPEEKETIKWISENTTWQRVDLWTTVVARCGLTVFQVK